jgi:acetylornithine/N-succinyldiaminopimelate aminotransferase
MSNNMDKQSYIDEAEKELLHTYNRFSLVLDHGEGVHLYDTDGNAYLDFAAGIAVCALGYSNEHHKEALKAQVDKLLHTSNLYYNTPVRRQTRCLRQVKWIVFSLPTAVQRP